MPVDEIEVAPGLWATRHFALWLKEESTVAISDLHLGFEAALAEQGVSVPRFQRREGPERLAPPPPGQEPRDLVHAGGFQDQVSKNPSHRGGGVIVLPAFSPLALGVDVASYPYLSPILNGIDVDVARVIGIDEKEGLLEFGRVGELPQADASLLLR